MSALTSEADVSAIADVRRSVPFPVVRDLRLVLSDRGLYPGISRFRLRGLAVTIAPLRLLPTHLAAGDARPSHPSNKGLAGWVRPNLTQPPAECSPRQD